MALVSKSFADLVTITRASGGGHFNASGQYEWLEANVPRINCDPVTGKSLGILVEEQRTNLFPQSSVFANLKEVTITAGAVTSPSGAQDGSHAVPSTVNSEHYADDLTTPLTAGGWYTFSTHVKADGSGYLLYIRVALATVLAFSFNPAVPSVPADTSTAKYGYTQLPNGWYRVWVSFQATATGNTVIRHQLTNAAGQIAFAGDGVSGIYLWGRQFEQGAFPTSHIPTSGAQVTRAADVPSVNVLSPWYNSAEGTIIAEVSEGYGSLSTDLAAVISADDGTANNRIQLRRNISTSNASIAIVDSGTVTVSKTTASGSWPADHVSRKVGLAFGAGAAALALSGKVVAEVGPAKLPTVTRVMLGSGPSVKPWNGHIRSIKYYPKRLTDTQLQELTA